MKHRHIVVEGPIGCGKTSLATRLAQKLGADVLLEDAKANPFLPMFYRDMRRYALSTQLFFLFQRVQQLEGIRQPDMFAKPIVADFTLAKDPLFARLTLDVQEDGGLRPGYKLKLNSYDLGVDIELHDALQRIRFEHPETRSVIVTSGKERMFCSGANIFMLGLSSHAWKVNFCKFTNETRNGIEDSSAHSGLKFIAACNGTTAGATGCCGLSCANAGDATTPRPARPAMTDIDNTRNVVRMLMVPSAAALCARGNAQVRAGFLRARWGAFLLARGEKIGIQSDDRSKHTRETLHSQH